MITLHVSSDSLKGMMVFFLFTLHDLNDYALEHELLAEPKKKTTSREAYVLFGWYILGDFMSR